MSKLIGFAGRARSGKDTSAEYVSAQTGFTQMAFADPIKDMICVMLGETREEFERLKDVEDDKAKEIGCTRRKLAQTLGTEWGRDLINPDLWVILLKWRHRAVMQQPEGWVWFKERFGMKTGVVVSDVRFANETNYVRDHGVVVHIQTDRDTIDENDHRSEVGIPIEDGDDVIFNSTTLGTLYLQLDRIIKRFIK